jgi:magnesium transporter
MKVASTLEGRLASALMTAHPTRAAAALERLGESSALGLLGEASKEDLARVLPALSPHFAAAVIAELPANAVGAALELLPVDVGVRMARLLDASVRSAVVGSLPSELEASFNALLTYPADTAGGLMDPSVLALADDLSAEDALDRVRELPEKARYNLYVVDRAQQLVGVLNLRELLLARPSSRLSELMRRNPHQLTAETGRANIVAHPGWRAVHCLPVVDGQNHYLGAIRYRTLRQIEDVLHRRDGRDDDQTMRALGEIFSVGAGGVLQALTSSGLRDGSDR